MSENGSRKQLLRASAMVTEMAVTVVLGLLAGGWVDRRLETSPLFLLLFTFLAFILGMVRLMRAIGKPGSSDEPPRP